MFYHTECAPTLTRGMINCVCFLLMSLCETLEAQSIFVRTTGHNQIAIQNQTNHSIAVQISYGETNVIYGGGVLSIPFKLSNYNVYNAPIIVTYDASCLATDKSMAQQWEQNINYDVEKFRLRVFGLISISNSDCSGLKSLLLYKGLSSILGGRTPYLDLYFKYFSAETLQGSVDYNDCESMRNAAQVALDSTVTFVKSQAAINRANSDSYFSSLLSQSILEQHTASEFLQASEKSFVELEPYYVFGYALNYFHGNPYIAKYELLKNAPLDKFPYYGGRLAMHWNSYFKSGTKKDGRQQFVVAEYFQSPATYKPSSDSVFQAGVAYNWQYYSFGYGQDYFNPNQRLPVRVSWELGLVTNSFNSGTRDSVLEQFTFKSKSTLQGIAPYVHFAFAVGLSNRFNISLGYTSTLFMRTSGNNKKDLPSNRYFNLGIGVKLFRKKSFQY